jgi:serine/threonine protein kinase
MLAEFYKLAQREVDLLIESDTHPNLISYYMKEEDKEFIYLALTYCPKTLSNCIEQEPHLLSLAEKFKILEGLARGLHHLHSLNISIYIYY